MDKNLPGPGDDGEGNEQGDIIPAGSAGDQTVDGPASDGNVQPGPEGDDREDPEQSSHRLNIEGGGKISACQPGEAGGHAATGAGDSGAESELALVEAERGVGPHSGWAWGEAGGGDHDGETDGANEQGEKPAGNAEGFGIDSRRKDEGHVREHIATKYRVASWNTNIWVA